MSLSNNNTKLLNSILPKILFNPVDDRVLIKPLKQKCIKKSFTVPVSKPKDLKEAEDGEIETKEEVREVPTNCQLGVVLKVDEGSINKPFKPGDTVVYPTNAGVPFELFKDSRLLKRYEILGLWGS